LPGTIRYDDNLEESYKDNNINRPLYIHPCRRVFFEMPRFLDEFMIPIVGLSIGDSRCSEEFWISPTVELPTLGQSEESELL